MRVTEIHYEDVDFRQFPFGLSNWANEMTLKADKGRTSEQRAQFKQQVIQQIEADRLMQVQQVELFIVGVAAHYLTPWGDPPITGQAFEEEALDALLAAAQGDPFVVHALAYETVLRVNRRILQHLDVLRPLAPGEEPRRLTRAEVEEVIADKEAIVQARYEDYQQRHGFMLQY